MTEYLTLDEMVAAPPLAAILSVCMALGVLWLGRQIARFAGKSDPLHVATGFAAAAGLIASVIHMAAWLGFLPLGVLRAVAWGIGALGIVEMRRNASVAATRLPEWHEWARGDRITSAAAILSGVAVLGLGLSALGPATDADSLDYHLGVPLDWIRNGGAYPRPDWLTARLVGVGDMLNLLGLAGGTDGFGAAMQVAGLLACVVAVGAVARTPRDRVLGGVLVVAAPVHLFLATSQKPQLLPVAATTLALILVVTEKRLEFADAILVGVCLGFAVASKHSFLISAGTVAVVFVFVALKKASLLTIALTAAVAAAIAAPQLARNAVFYGDPLTPMLEHLKSSPQAAVVSFADYLKAYGAPPRTPQGLLRATLALLVPGTTGQVTGTLGLGALAVVFIRPADAVSRRLVIAAALVAAAIVVVGQPTGRFFLEPYLWFAGAFVASSGERWKRLMGAAVTAQTAFVAVAALVGAALLAPGGLTPSRRTETMRRAANGYEEAAWLDSIAPANTRILTYTRSHALAPRPFLAGDLVRSPETLAEALSLDRVETVVMSPDDLPALLQRVRKACRVIELGSRTFKEGTRMPFGGGAEYRLVALRVEAPDECAAALARR